ncbi:MAG: carbamoyltransferase C-terminal domain-containing protein, partial [Burkholderiales bacterium]
KLTNPRFAALFGGEPRAPDEAISQRHMDLAASVQQVTEEVMLKLTASLAAETGISNLCLAGGVALNCVANGKVLRQGSFKRIWIQPAAGDAGGALGAALSAWYGFLDKPRSASGAGDQMKGSYLGPAFAQDDIEQRLSQAGARFDVLDETQLLQQCASDMAQGKALGWFQGRMEFGPRALGGRSILADPRSASMQKTLNLKVKQRESFRPFAPSVRRENVADWFELDTDSPYMLLVANVNERHRVDPGEQAPLLGGLDQLKAVRSDIPAVTHVDCSARIQTVDATTNPRYHALLGRFNELTGCPLLVNTSFNVRGEPIVCTPEDAFRCFMATGIDVLAIGQCYLRKEAQIVDAKDYVIEFEDD